MSMYRQLWLAIIASMLMALAGGLLVSTLNARDYLEVQLSSKNSDNATALALSMSQGSPDETMVGLLVASMFDRGHYALIRVTDPTGKVMAELAAPEGNMGAPAWFVRLLPIRASAGTAQISSGWKQFGTITLESHSRFAYGALWKSATQMVMALALAALVGGYFATLVLRRLRRPLDAVIAQAKAITQRRFVTIAEPAVPELKQLASAMNATVTRLKSMFEDEATRLDAMRREANCDALTGLANRSYFMARLRDSATAEDSTGGTLFIVRLAHLASVNQSLGRHATDELLRVFGNTLSEAAGEHTQALAARLNGADFALLVPALAVAQEDANRLLQSLAQAAAAYLPDQTSSWMAGGHFARGVEVETILAQVDVALATVEAEGRNTVLMVDLHAGDEAPKSADEWARTIRCALERRWVRLVSFPVVTLGGQMLHRECPLRLMFDEQGEWQPAGRFLPMAERLKLTPQLDLAAVALGLDELEANPQLAGLAINLSASSIALPQFRKELQALLLRRSATRRLWLEVAESGVLAHFDAFRALCLELQDLGCQMGIEHFGRQFSQVGRLHGLGLDYLKVDASFIRDLDANPGNQSFLKGLSTIAHSIGMRVIAEGVVSQAELLALSAAGFDGATGPGVTSPGV